MNETARTALVLGAGGGIGGEVTRQLHAAGWQVRALRRAMDKPEEWRDGIHWVRGDAMVRDDLLRAADGCEVIVHAVNPPGYRRWDELVLPMIDHTIAAAEAQRATIVLPGNVYNYGPDVFAAPIAEDAPQHPRTRKGAIRVTLEQRLQQAAARGRAKVIIVRAGDFFGPTVGNSWFSQGLVKRGRAVRRASLPGAHGVGHQWAYLPDVARTMVALLARRGQLGACESFHMAGHWDADGTAMGKAIVRAAERRGEPAPKVGAFAWRMVRLASPLVPTFRELLEMRYLWNEPVRLDNTRLRQLLGQEPHTPLDDAVEATLQAIGCLPHRAARPEVRV